MKSAGAFIGIFRLRELCRELVGDLLVTFCHSRFRFPAVCRPLLLAGEFALELGEALPRVTVKLLE